MREITDHRVAGSVMDGKVRVFAVDEKGKGGANQHYEVKVEGSLLTQNTPIHFQNGSPNEGGVNGMTNEALLAIVIDRLKGFSEGQFKDRETSIALTHCQTAMHWLQHRTRERIDRGVEGQLKA